MNTALLIQLDQLSVLGRAHDAIESEHSRRMLNIMPDTGRLLWILARSLNAQRVLEIGTSNGYSTIWLADAVAEQGGRVTTLERSADKIEMADAQLRESNLRAAVEIIEGDARNSLPTLEGAFDLVFLDADRASYLDYLPLIVERLRPGGLLVTDNVTSHPTEVAAFLAAVRADERLATVTVPIGNGEEISIRL
ncbi:MAG: O-methyltransferase [Chloroflexi bacterium]|nr:O-methyltransferase [Chloroflexota bacterium]MDA1146670.1 O-methyltransferase [Chloroflexota bacterium]